MITLKEFIEVKLIEVGWRNIRWKRENDKIYLYCTNPDDNGAVVKMPLTDLIDDLLWQENGV